MSALKITSVSPLLDESVGGDTLVPTDRITLFCRFEDGVAPFRTIMMHLYTRMVFARIDYATQTVALSNLLPLEDNEIKATYLKHGDQGIRDSPIIQKYLREAAEIAALDYINKTL